MYKLSEHHSYYIMIRFLFVSYLFSRFFFFLSNLFYTEKKTYIFLLQAQLLKVSLCIYISSNSLICMNDTAQKLNYKSNIFVPCLYTSILAILGHHVTVPDCYVFRFHYSPQTFFRFFFFSPKCFNTMFSTSELTTCYNFSLE